MPKKYAFYYKDEELNKVREFKDFAYECGFILYRSKTGNYSLDKVGTENISIIGKDLSELEKNLKAYLANHH